MRGPTPLLVSTAPGDVTEEAGHPSKTRHSAGLPFLPPERSGSQRKEAAPRRWQIWGTFPTERPRSSAHSASQWQVRHVENCSRPSSEGQRAYFQTKAGCV